MRSVGRSGWTSIIFLKNVFVVPHLEPCCVMGSNNSLAVIHLWLLNKNHFEGYCFLYEAFLQLKRERESFLLKKLKYKGFLLDNYTQIQKRSTITLMFELKFKLLWIYITNRPFKFSTIIYSAKIISESL